MSVCYWGKCTCPDHEPCAQHAGFQCGYWNGTLIQDPTQVNDALTRDAEMGLFALDADRDLVRDMRVQIEQKRADLKNERDDIDRVLSGPSSFGQRRQTARKIEQAYSRLGQIRSESRQVVADLDSINARASSAGALISTYLIIPYTSSAGYCSCYDTKRDRLATIATQIAQQNARLTPLFIRRNAIHQEFIRTFSLLPNRTTVFRMLGSIVFLAAIIVFIFLNAAAAVITAIVGLLLIAVVLLDTIINLMDIEDQIMAIRQNIVRLNLAYYRMQSIATCLEAPLPEEEDENIWWKQAVPDYAVEPDSTEE